MDELQKELKIRKRVAKMWVQAAILCF